MICRTAYETATGAIRWSACGVDGVIEFPEEPGLDWVDGEWSAATHYVLSGEPTPRPTIGLPEIHTITASTDWILSDVPAGTEVEVDGEVVGTTDETGLTLSFDAPGIWPVRLRPPFPWVEASCEVTVT